MSEYVQSLNSQNRLRYCDKVVCINSIDPYTITEEMCKNQKCLLPKVDLLDIESYFVLTHSAYTAEQIKAFKALDAFRFYKAGFVSSVRGVKINENFVVLADVKHSQKMNAKDLKPWVILASDGSILTAHCTCMAGLGESCSHVAAVTFYLHFHGNELLSCTDRLSVWKVPKTTKKVEFKQIKDMNWSKNCTSYDDIKGKNVVPLQGDALNSFLNKIHEVTPDAAIFRVTEPFASDYAAAKQTVTLPKSLSKLVNQPEFMKYSLENLRQIRMNLSITEDQQDKVFAATLDQSDSELWYEQQAGRITDSLFKNICMDSVENPSLTLIKSICYPMKSVINIPSINYEKLNKKNALEAYLKNSLDCHKNFKYIKSGLIISKEHPYFAASPDGIITCDCCDSGGCLEIICPYKMKEFKFNIEDFAKMKDSYLIKNENGYELDKSHTYYFQVQFKMFCADNDYCDLVIWSKKEVMVLRISIDKVFLQNNLMKAKNYHDMVIVPELLGKYFTRQKDPKRSVEWACI